MSKTDDSQTSRSRHKITSFFSNPLVGIIGSIASIVGLFLAVYFYFEGKETSLLTYYVNTVKATVVKAGQASKLTASYNNKVIETDITASQIALWNEGKLPIKRSGILKPIIIYTENETPILEATIRKTSRDVIQLELNTEDLQHGRITVSWAIFEQGDGAIVQLIYAGSPDVNIFTDGVIEGQKEIIRQESDRLKSSEEQITLEHSVKRGSGLIFVILGSVMLIVSVFTILGKRRSKGLGVLVWPLITLPLPVIGIGTYFLITSKSLGPPFGF
ncbi:MAG: hypothetical protein HYV59_12490 [Planctomycetes bacterium]|nr:hypothetical protein [Planctomycetota bacterium]